MSILRSSFSLLAFLLPKESLLFFTSSISLSSTFLCLSLIIPTFFSLSPSLSHFLSVSLPLSLQSRMGYKGQDDAYWRLLYGTFLWDSGGRTDRAEHQFFRCIQVTPECPRVSLKIFLSKFEAENFIRVTPSLSCFLLFQNGISLSLLSFSLSICKFIRRFWSRSANVKETQPRHANS